MNPVTFLIRVSGKDFSIALTPVEVRSYGRRPAGYCLTVVDLRAPASSPKKLFTSLQLKGRQQSMFGLRDNGKAYLSRSKATGALELVLLTQRSLASGLSNMNGGGLGGH
jgi:hypothetical protein